MNRLEHIISFTLVLLLATLVQAADTNKDYPIQPVPFNQVHIQDQFWTPRIETNRTVTIPYDFKKCEETGRINNFAIAGGLMEGDFEGIYFNDSDVYKVIEGAAYSLSTHPDPQLEKYLDDLIVKIAAAQEDDGYLYTIRTIQPEKLPKSAGQERWAYLCHSHEFYNVGHMYEAAVAYFQATGKRSLLNVAIKSADLIYNVFGPDKKRGVPGHQEIEIGLAKLYRVTGNNNYLELAKYFLDERGRANDPELYGKYLQAHKPVLEQSEAVGHSVRAGYMYTGMADVAALTNNADYIRSIDRIWENVVTKKLYLTGGIGARHKHEAFGDAYELPNATAYNETCAAIANAFWNHRLFLLHGDSKYIDVLERVIYNGFLSGISLEGNKFFYPNPLASDGKYEFNNGSATRQPWFSCSCCPVNIVRFIPSLPGYIYANRDQQLYVNLYIGNSGTFEIANTNVNIKQETNYPWDGKIKVTIDPAKSAEFTVNIRIPGWAQGKPVPSDLYFYKTKMKNDIKLKVNGKVIPLKLEKGYAAIHRTWEKGDEIDLDLPMPIRRVISNEKVVDNRERVALERGPIVYCVESVDNGGSISNLILSDESKLKVTEQKDLLGGLYVIKGKTKSLTLDEKTLKSYKVNFTAIPYYAWSHRGVGEMAVWMPRTEALVRTLLTENK